MGHNERSNKSDRKMSELGAKLRPQELFQDDDLGLD